MLLSRKAPRLLRRVKNEEWANEGDHEDAGARPAAKPQKGFISVPTSLQAAENFDAEPASSSDSGSPISSADIRPSFDSNGRSMTTRDSAPPPRRTTARPGANRKPVERPHKLRKLSDDQDKEIGFELFDFSKRKTKTTYGSKAADFQKPVSRLQTYGKKPQNQLKMPPLETPKSRPPGTKYKKAPLLTPSPSQENHASPQADDDQYGGASDYLDLPDAIDDSNTSEKSKEKRNKASTKSQPGGRRGKNKLQPAPHADFSSPKSSAPSFKMPLQAAHVDVEEFEKEIEEERRRESAELAALIPDEGPCPMRCGKILKRERLETLDPKASIREQVRFCRNHRIEDAKEDWKKNKYPTIDWRGLPSRLEGYEDDLVRMIKHPEALWFRKEMEERNKRGKDRTIMQHLKHEGMQGIGVGYYGQRGGDIMADYITRNFAADLRDRAGSDKIMSSRGTTAYIQMVLVLELATLLIKEDKNVDTETARRIMSQSTTTGELLNPSVGGASSRQRGRIVLGGEE